MMHGYRQEKINVGHYWDLKRNLLYPAVHFAYFGFLFSLNHLSGPLRKYIFTWTSSKGHGFSFVIGGCRSVLFVSYYKACCFVIVLFWAIIDQLSLLRRFLGFFSFLSLARIKQCLPTSFDKKSTHHRDFLCYS